MKVIKDSFTGLQKQINEIIITTSVGAIVETKSGRAFDAGEPTKYRWLTGKLKSTGQEGSVLIWETNFAANPEKYREGKSLDIEINLEGDYVGSAQEHLGGGAFDISDIGLSPDEMKLFVSDLVDEVEEEQGQTA